MAGKLNRCAQLELARGDYDTTYVVMSCACVDACGNYSCAGFDEAEHRPGAPAPRFGVRLKQNGTGRRVRGAGNIRRI